MASKVCSPIPTRGAKCMGPARYETLYASEFVCPEREDYRAPKTGGGWFRHPAKAVRNMTPYKTDTSIYRVEFSRVQVPVDPVEEARKAAEEQRKKREQEEAAKEAREKGLEEEFCRLLKPHGVCAHSDHKRPTSKLEFPIKYPYTMFDPENVDYDRPFSPPPPKVFTYPKKVTEDEIRNQVRQGPRGTKGFFEPGKDGPSSATGMAASDAYYRDIRPLEGTILSMNANRSIKSSFIC